MYKIYLSLIFLFCTTEYAQTQTIFEDDFDSYTLNSDIILQGYEIAYNNAYSGNVTGIVTNESSNQFVNLFADTNGQALMQLRKTVAVQENNIYTFSAETQGRFKRRLRVYNAADNSLLFETTDIDPEGTDETEWFLQELHFKVPPGVSNIKIGVYHNWSGSLWIDNYELKHKDPSKYYLSNSGDDMNDGSIVNPWSSLEKLSNTTLAPGDTIFFNNGDRFDGHFVVNGSGSASNPIVLTSYGSGNKPIITGEVGAAEGGDYQEAIYIENQDHITFDGLEIHNERTNSRTGVDDRDAYGIHITNTGSQIMNGFIFRNMTFQNVYAVEEMNDPDDFNGLEVAALRFFTEKNTVAGQEKNIENVLMENCYFTDLQRLGVHIKHGGANTGIGNDEINRNKDFIFRNNEFHYLGGTCILPIRTYNCLIEDNLFNYPGATTDPRMPGRGSSVWTWRCINTVIQNNTCLHIRGYLDSHGIHIDHDNLNTFVQYNYMEDCEGGFVEILGGNINAVYRFNISINDGWRVNPGWVNSNHTIWLNQKSAGDVIHPSEYSYIYNNTVVINSGFTTAIDINAKYTHIYNNIFYSTNGSGMGNQQMNIQNNGTPLFMTNNLFHGNVVNSFESNDSAPVNANPLFNSENSGDAFGYQYLLTSGAVNAGIAQQGPPVIGAGTGIFIDVPEYPTHDYYGNEISLASGTPNIGACNAKNGEIILSNNGVVLDINKPMISPNPVKSNLKIIGLENTNTKISIFNIHGQLILSTNINHNIDVAHLKTGIYFARVENQTLRFVKAD